MVFNCTRSTRSNVSSNNEVESVLFMEQLLMKHWKEPPFFPCSLVMPCKEGEDGTALIIEASRRKPHMKGGATGLLLAIQCKETCNKGEPNPKWSAA